mgnify:CR=1 FL=1
MEIKKAYCDFEEQDRRSSQPIFVCKTLPNILKEAEVQEMKQKESNKTNRTKQEFGKPQRKSRPFACQTHAFLPPLGLTIILIIALTINSYGQIETPKPPKVSTFEQVNINQTPTYKTPGENNYQRNNGTAIYENDLKKQQSRQQMIYEIRREAEMANSKTAVSYELPSYGHIPATNHYKSAFSELVEMIDTNYSVQRANFIVENAFYENQGKYESFDNLITQIGQFLIWKMEELNYDQSSNLSKNLILFQFFSDTLKIELKNLEHLPFKYEFDDYMGHNDWANMFVEKLLRTNKGQCHSLPLLYLILAEEIGAEAHLAFSPNHSYIKFQDDNGKWINVELTNGMLTTDAFILQSGYMKAEALQNKIYMQPLTKKQLLSEMMVDLAKGYSIKFGYDEFVEQVIEKAIEIYPTNVFAQMVKSDYRTLHFFYVQRQINVPPDRIHEYPKAKELLDKMYEQYEIVDNLGYEEMPLEDYEKWLNSLNEAKQKQESQQMILKLNKSIEFRR